MSSLKQRYEQFAEFMQQNNKGVEVCVWLLRKMCENVIYWKEKLFLFLVTDRYLFHFWNFICGFLLQNSTGNFIYGIPCSIRTIYLTL